MVSWCERDNVVRCRIAGAVVGGVVFLWLLFVSGLSIVASLFLAAITGVFFTGILSWAICQGRGGAAEDAELLTADWEPTPFTSVWGRPSRFADLDDSAGAAAPSADSEAGRHRGAAAGRIEPLRRRVAEADGASGAPAGEAPADGNSADGASVGEVSAAGPSADADADAAVPDAAGSLDRIKGIGPRMVETLAANGVTDAAQIAAWDEAEIARFEGILGRQGYRIRSEDWVGQARALDPEAAGAGSAAADAGTGS